MRKMLNKKGFSLVELMIVVVIMGILIAVAIPLYNNITRNAKDKTCASNIDTIENAAVVYMTENGKSATENGWKTELKFDGGKAPTCPWGEGLEGYQGYTVKFDANGSATVTCGAKDVAGSHVKTTEATTKSN